MDSLLTASFKGGHSQSLAFISTCSLTANNYMSFFTASIHLLLALPLVPTSASLYRNIHCPSSARVQAT